MSNPVRPGPPRAADLERHATFYRRRGWNPLPSRRCRDGKLHPPYRFSAFRDAGLSPMSFSRIAVNFSCDCIQLALGVRWKLAVIDLDGPLAVEVWKLWTLHRELPATWWVRHDPRGGMHLWFRIERSLPCRTVLWRDDSGSHSMIELLGDGSLIVAPPSVSVRTGRAYRFVRGHSPADVPVPALLPEWIQALPDKLSDRPRPDPLPVPTVPVLPSFASTGSGLNRAAVIEQARLNAVSVARSLGLRVVDDLPNQAGWCRARSMFRPDQNPSAMFNPAALLWWEPEFGHKPMSIFDAAMALGHAATFPESMRLVGRLAGCRA